MFGLKKRGVYKPSPTIQVIDFRVHLHLNLTIWIVMNSSNTIEIIFFAYVLTIKKRPNSHPYCIIKYVIYNEVLLYLL